jgi:hypothetical protein
VKEDVENKMTPFHHFLFKDSFHHLSLIFRHSKTEHIFCFVDAKHKVTGMSTRCLDHLLRLWLLTQKERYIGIGSRNIGHNMKRWSIDWLFTTC